MSKNTKKIGIILGTRPELIKMSSVIKECLKRKLDFFIIHTGQHYSYNMDKIFFNDLELPSPKYNLEVGSGSHAKQTSLMLLKIEEILIKENPDVVLLQGDTNSVLAGSLAAVKLHIKVGHIEAGLRSHDRYMPEEINRILTDHIADYLFAPTEETKENLLKEGIESEKIFVTGNTIVDSVLQNVEIANAKSKILKTLEISSQEYIVLTLHRAENVDLKDKLKNALSGIRKVSMHTGLPILWSIHPRTQKRIEEYKLENEVEEISTLRKIEPTGFLDFIVLESNAKLILTDSGGIQEESCILKVPCVTLRDNTERPESVHVGANVLAGTDPDKILESSKKMLKKKRYWENPFGDGTSSKIIIDTLY